MKEPFAHALLDINRQRTVISFHDGSGARGGGRKHYVAPETITADLIEAWPAAHRALRTRRTMTLIDIAVIVALMISLFLVAPRPDYDEFVGLLLLNHLFAVAPIFLILTLAYLPVGFLLSKVRPPKSQTLPPFDQDYMIPEDIAEPLSRGLREDDRDALLAIDEPEVFQEALRILALKYNTSEVARTRKVKETKAAALNAQARRHLHQS